MPETMGEMEMPAEATPEADTPKSANEVGEDTAMTSAEVTKAQEGLPRAELSPEAEKAFDQLAALSKEEIDQMLIEVMKDHAESSAITEANKIREQLGLEQREKRREEAEERVQFIAEQQEKLEEEKQKLGELALGFPDGVKDEAIRELSLPRLEMKEYEGLEEQQIEANMKEGREKMVAQFIDATVKKFMEDFSEEIDGSENKEAITKLIELKTKTFIQKKAQAFIEYNEESDLSVEGTIRFAYFDKPDGTRHQYVTGFEIESIPGFNLGGENTDTDLELGISEEERAGMDAAQEAGELEERRAA